jgi:hypothetical protein
MTLNQALSVDDKLSTMRKEQVVIFCNLLTQKLSEGAEENSENISVYTGPELNPEPFNTKKQY